MANFENAHSYVIPKIIHQIWIGPNKMPNFWANTWKELYMSEVGQEYTYVLWTESNCENELNKYPILKRIYTALTPYCLKADILRYIILCEYGGIYIDIDSVWINSKSLDDVLHKSSETGFFAGQTPNTTENNFCYLTNGVIGCSKGNLCMKHIMSDITGRMYNFSTKQYDDKLVKNMHSSRIVGPGAITRMYRANSDKVTIIPSDYFYPILWHGIKNLHSVNFDEYENSNSIMFQYGYTTNHFQPTFGLNDVYWINLERTQHRAKHMYYLFAKYMIFGNRVNAYDGQSINAYSDILFEDSCANVSAAEYCCMFSHLKAIKCAQDNCIANNTQHAIICEDDMCLDFAPKWQHSLDEIIKSAPSDWEIIKLHCNYAKHIHKLIKRGNLQKCMFFPWEIRSTSTLCYVINVSGMNKIITKYTCVNSGKWTLRDDMHCKADVGLFSSVTTYDYAVPFVNHLVCDSSINTGHICVHVEGAESIKQYFDKL